MSDLSTWWPADVPDADRALLERIHGWDEDRELAALSRERLRQLSDSQGNDWALALLYDRIVHHPQHQSFIARIEALRGSWRSTARPMAARVVIVPGALHVEHPQVGGDGRVVRAAAAVFPCPVEMPPFGSADPASRSVPLLLDFLRATSPGPPVILVSLSKGSLDVKHALAHAGANEALARIVAWLDLSGSPMGTPVADRLLGHWPLRWLTRAVCGWRGHDVRFVEDLRTPGQRALFYDVPVPPHLRVIHVSGFPLRRHVAAPLLQRQHRRMIPLGPNDGVTLLAHLAATRGRVYPIWGVDHYVHPPWDLTDLAGAILTLIAEEANLWAPQATSTRAGSPRSTAVSNLNDHASPAAPATTRHPSPSRANST